MSKVCKWCPGGKKTTSLVYWSWADRFHCSTGHRTGSFGGALGSRNREGVQKEEMMARILEKSRYLILLAVGASLVASAVAFLWGCWKTIQAIVQIVSTAGKDPGATVSQIALMDKFLIATGLYIFAVGMYELFIGELSMPAWLTVHSLHEVKSRLSAIIILVMAIVFLEHLVEWKDPQGTLYFGIAVAVVTAALIVFSYFGERD
jgi:uncharacterized membrane protein YqhA